MTPKKKLLHRKRSIFTMQNLLKMACMKILTVLEKREIGLVYNKHYILLTSTQALHFIADNCGHTVWGYTNLTEMDA
jgi:hypothetical protein